MNIDSVTADEAPEIVESSLLGFVKAIFEK